MSATMTLTEFLLARIAEDAEAARASDSRRWTESTDRQHIVSTASEGGLGIVQDRRAPDSPFSWLRPGERTTHVVSCSQEHRVRGREGCSVPHIARHDPARVLAECEAKRRIVHEYIHAGDVAELEQEADRMSEAYDFWAQESTLEGVVKRLAAVYADHPDYREEWRP